MAEHPTSLGTNIVSFLFGRGRLGTFLGSSVTFTAHRPILKMNGQTGAVLWFSVYSFSLKRHCLYNLPGGTDYIHHIFLSGSLTMIAKQIYMILSHFGIVFQFSSTFIHRLFFAKDPISYQHEVHINFQTYSYCHVYGGMREDNDGF
jgi:hypothetical protein